jgi:hypothetical protein
MILLRSHGLRRDKCRNGDKGWEGENSQRSHDGTSSLGGKGDIFPIRPGRKPALKAFE